MLASSGEGGVEVRINLYRGFPLHIRSHGPFERDGASDLYMRSYVVFRSENMLRFYEVCRVSFFIKATYQEPTSRPATVFPRNEFEAKVAGLLSHVETIDTRGSKRHKSLFFEFR